MSERNTVKEFYESWSQEQLQNPCREPVLKWKAVNLANLILRNLFTEKIDSICEIGGAEGIVLKTIGDIVNASSKTNYELSSTFCRIGKNIHSDIDFVNSEYIKHDCNKKFNLIVLSDITEHVEDDLSLLKNVSEGCKYVVLKMPIEKSLFDHNIFYKILRRKRPDNLVFGSNHYNGHLRGYSVRSALAAVSQSFDVVDFEISVVSYFYPSKKADFVNNIFGSKMAIYLFGGALFVLAKSK